MYIGNKRDRAQGLPACVIRDQYYDADSITGLFGATTFKMVMKRHLQEGECADLFSTTARPTTTVVDHHSIQQFSEEMRIIDGHLMHRLKSLHFCVGYITTHRRSCIAARKTSSHVRTSKSTSLARTSRRTASSGVWSATQSTVSPGA